MQQLTVTVSVQKVVLVYAIKAYEEIEVQLHSTLTSTTDAVSGQFHVPTALSLGKESVVRTEQKTGWAPAPVLTLWRRCKYVASGGNRTRILRMSS